MRRLYKTFITFLLLAVIYAQPAALVSGMQTPPPPTAATKSKDKKPGDYSDEAFVIEQMKTVYRYEKDGTGLAEHSMRVKIQTDAGVQAFGELPFPYSSANEKMDIDFVRVLKKDGSIINAPASSVKEMEAPVYRVAPVYSDLKIKVVTVPGLRPGDTLEFHATTHVFAAVAPNQFWVEQNFVGEPVIVLDQQLEVNIPQSSVVKLKSEKGLDPIIKEENNRRIYTWKHANLEHPKKEDKDKTFEERFKELESGQQKAPQVQLSTFKNWDEVGKWYDELQRDRIIPDETIKAKVAELIKGKTTDLEKIEALYSFVASNFRYVSLSFGQGRYQPHAAAEILANQYGDCKDKHTLLSAMLAAAGIHAYPVLINPYRKLDSDVPSPAQFNHVITAIPIDNKLVWMDTTPEVAPFQLLSKSLRKKQALYIPENAEARLETTPAEVPFPTLLSIEVTATADEKGKVTGHVHARLRSDSELTMRTRFRSTPPSQWTDMSYAMGYEEVLKFGYGFKITDIKPSDPNALEKPFEIDFDISSIDFDNTHSVSSIKFPLPEFRLPGPPGDKLDKADKQDEAKPTEFQLPSEITYRVKLTLADNLKKQPKLPRPIALDRDYAEYHSSYKIEGNTIIGERVLHLRQRELAVNNNQDYQAFYKSVSADESQWLSWDLDKPTAKTEAESEAIPESKKADELIEEAETASRDGKLSRAEALLQRVVTLEPKHKTAYSELGAILLRESKYDAAVKVFTEQTKLNPFDANAFGSLGSALQSQQKYTEAEAAYRKQIQLAPLNASAHGDLGQMLVEIKRYKEAVVELELAIEPDDNESSQTLINLGRAYLNLGQREKAAEVFTKAVDQDDYLENDVAYAMALGSLNLDKAQEYAQSAVLNAESTLLTTGVSRLEKADLSDVKNLAMRWDTLGWVLYKKGDIDSAEKYIKAAWLIDQQSVMANHLGEVSEKRSKKDEAIHWYVLANAIEHPETEAKENLARLVAKDKIDAMIAKAKTELVDMQTFKLGSLLKGEKEKVEAEFYVMFIQTASQGMRVAAVKFIDGSEKLKSQESALKNLPWKISFPDDTSTKIVLNGKITCQPGGECSMFVSTQPATKADEKSKRVLVYPRDFLKKASDR